MNSKRRSEPSKGMKRSTSYAKVKPDERAERMSDGRIDPSTNYLNLPPETHKDHLAALLPSDLESCNTAIQAVPEIVVPENLRFGVTKPSRYEPGINLTFEQMAQHYGVAGCAGAAARAARRSQSQSQECWWPSVGSWARCANAPSSLSASRTRPSGSGTDNMGI